MQDPASHSRLSFGSLKNWTSGYRISVAGGGSAIVASIVRLLRHVFAWEVLDLVSLRQELEAITGVVRMGAQTQGVPNAIMEIISGQDAAWCAGDADAFGAGAMPDIVFTNVVGMFSVGVEAFNAQHAHIFSTIYKGSRLSQELVHVTMAADEVAIVDTLTSVTGFGHLPPGAVAIDGALRTRLEQVLVRRDGKWRVQAFHNVPVSPAAMSVARPGA